MNQYDASFSVYGEIEVDIQADSLGQAITKALKEAREDESYFGVLGFPKVRAFTGKNTGENQYRVRLGVLAVYDDLVEADNQQIAAENAWHDLNWQADLGALEGKLMKADLEYLSESV